MIYIIIWIYKNKEWKDINYKNIIEGRYEISNFGEIRNKKSGRILKTQCNKKGYHELFLRTNTGKQFVSVHRLVAIHFVKNDNPFEKNEVNHKFVEVINGKRIKSNYFENLEWVTRLENIKHSIETGLTYHPVGEENAVSTYKEEHIKFICECYEKGFRTISIYKKLIKNFPYLIDEHTPTSIKSRIRKIKSRRSWTHISKYYNY